MVLYKDAMFFQYNIQQREETKATRFDYLFHDGLRHWFPTGLYIGHQYQS